jgi:hypothetical protein
MMLEPLPNVDHIFSLLVQQERQMQNPLDETRMMGNLNLVYSQTKSQGHGKTNQYLKFSSSKPSYGKGQSKHCTFCQKQGRTEDTCYKKYGYPPNTFKKESTINNCVQDTIETNSVDVDNSPSKDNTLH